MSDCTLDAQEIGEMVSALGRRDEVAVFAKVDRVLELGWNPRQFLSDLRTELDANNNAPLMAALTEIADLGLREMEGSISPRLLLELTCARMLLPSTGRFPAFSPVSDDTQF